MYQHRHIDAIDNVSLTDPGQKISEGHQACFGGRGACEGNTAFDEAVTFGTAVSNVMGGAEGVEVARTSLEPRMINSSSNGVNMGAYPYCVRRKGGDNKPK
jgi:hypothetical protein